MVFATYLAWSLGSFSLPFRMAHEAVARQGWNGVLDLDLMTCYSMQSYERCNGQEDTNGMDGMHGETQESWTLKSGI